MAQLHICDRCEGFLPSHSTTCPHCDRPSLPRRLLNVAGGGAIAMTLMACYGGAPHNIRPVEPEGAAACGPGGDRDHDGSCTPADCNDNDPNVGPTANDSAGDGIDQNCDGQDGVAAAPAAGVLQPR